MATRTDRLADESRPRICAVENAERRIARNILLLVAKQAVSVFASTVSRAVVSDFAYAESVLEAEFALLAKP